MWALDVATSGGLRRPVCGHEAEPMLTMTTIKLLAFYALIWMFGILTITLSNHSALWLVPVAIAGFVILNIAAWRLLPKKAEPKELLMALLISMMVSRAIFHWWR